MAAALVAGVALSVVVSGVEAAFPGRNGAIAVPRAGQAWLSIDPSDGEITRVASRRVIFDIVGSPDGRHVAYTERIRTGASNIRVARRDGARSRLVARNGHSPTWAPGGNRLAFTREGTVRQGAGLYVVSRTGRGLRRLTRHALDRTPRWSPRGNVLAFVRLNPRRRGSGCDINGGIRTIRPGGGPSRRLWLPDFECGLVESMQWAPSGRRLVVKLTRSVVEGTSEPADEITRARVGINILDVGDSGLRRILLNGFSPTWSPDGTEIAYVAGDVGSSTEGVFRACNPDPPDRTGRGRRAFFVCGISPDGSQRREIARLPSRIGTGGPLDWFVTPR